MLNVFSCDINSALQNYECTFFNDSVWPVLTVWPVCLRLARISNEFSRKLTRKNANIGGQSIIPLLTCIITWQLCFAGLYGKWHILIG